MRAKPDMKPWVFTDKNRMSSFRSGTNSVSVVGLLLWGCAAPTGLKKCISMPNPGLAPWARQECRPCRAQSTSLPPINYVVVLMRMPWKMISFACHSIIPVMVLSR